MWGLVLLIIAVQVQQHHLGLMVSRKLLRITNLALSRYCQKVQVLVFHPLEVLSRMDKLSM